MELVDYVTVRTEAAREFDDHENTQDGARIARSLSEGLTNLRDLMFKRIDEDVQTNMGCDSMIQSLKPDVAEHAAKIEIELYQIVEASRMARSMKLVNDPEWFRGWLGRLRLGQGFDEKPTQTRIAELLKQNAEGRRLSFMGKLHNTLPDTIRAPLILFQLFPLAVRIVTAVAFNRGLDAAELRNRQTLWQPAIQDCEQCHGRPLDNGERCPSCGNPLWCYKWLQSTE